jgi:transglutaminase-like putative cysteine protease
MTLEPPGILGQDVWDQPVASFPGNSFTASISFKAVMREVRYHVFPEMVGSMSDIPPALVEKYTADGSMLKIGDARIRKAAEEVLAAAGAKPAAEKAYWIARLGYEYTIRHVPYKRGIPWISAPEALELGKATCSPISFVFVAICRACGLPARFAAGTKYRGAGNPFDREFHRWPEAYLPDYGWISADPSLPTYMDLDPEPAKIAYSFGSIPDNTYILMTGGGGSDIFGWGYNGAGGEVQVEWREVKPD